LNKKKVVSLALASVLVISTLAMGKFSFNSNNVNALDVGESNTKNAVASTPAPKFFSAVAMETDTVERLKAKGENVQQPSPSNIEKLEAKFKFDKPEEPKPLTLGEIEAIQNTFVVLVKFPTKEDGSSSVPGAPRTRVPASYFQDLIFGTEYNPYDLKEGDLDFTNLAEYEGIKAPTDSTLYNYYKEVSYGKVEVSTYDDIVWVTAPHPYEYYMNSAFGFGNYPQNVQGLVQDALMQVDDQVDFSKYAIDGEVPGVFVVHEGTGAEFSQDPWQIWSHKWQLSWKYDEEVGDYVYQPFMLDGVVIDTYSMEPEVGGDLTGFSGFQYGPLPPYVGVYAHEFAHVLGLPDLYDYGYESAGVGAWSVMAGGSWTRYPNNYYYSGNKPVHLDAWNKYFAGLVDVKEVKNNETIDFSLDSSVSSNVIYKIDVPRSHGTEYFLIENRQQDGFDQGLGRYGTDMHGLAVWHVDDNVLYRSFSRPNEAENWNPDRNGERYGYDANNGEHHYGVSLVQADGEFSLEQGYRGDGGDVFRSGSLELTSDIYSGSFYHWPGSNGEGFFKITNIQEENGVITGTIETDSTGSYKKK
jgi:immune inhibitor A